MKCETVTYLRWNTIIDLVTTLVIFQLLFNLCVYPEMFKVSCFMHLHCVFALFLFLFFTVILLVDLILMAKSAKIL